MKAQAAQCPSATFRLAWLLLIAGLVPWRHGAYFDGGTDPVVLAKAALQFLALMLAIISMIRTQHRQPLGGRSLMLLGLLVGVSSIGALAVGDAGASSVLSVRLLLVAATIMVLLRISTARTAIESLLIAMALVGGFSALTGVTEWFAGGRLRGSIPPLSPNGIAMLCGLPALATLHEIVHGRGKPATYAAFLALTGIVVATESRTALFGLAISIIVLLLYVRNLKPSVAIMLIAAVPAGFCTVMYTPVLHDLLFRGDGGSITTLNSRTIAWAAVLNTPADTWERWIGAGLSVKTVSVDGQYWNQQVLDSSWISVLAQAGVLGAILLVFWCVTTLFASHKALPIRSFTTAALVFILTRSFLENGLVEASTTFVVFFTMALLVETPRLTMGPVKPSGSHPQLTSTIDR